MDIVHIETEFYLFIYIIFFFGGCNELIELNICFMRIHVSSTTHRQRAVEGGPMVTVNCYRPPPSRFFYISHSRLIWFSRVVLFIELHFSNTIFQFIYNFVFVQFMKTNISFIY